MIDGRWEAPGAYPGTSGPSGSKLFCLRSVKGNDIIKKNVKERGTWNGDEQREPVFRS